MHNDDLNVDPFTGLPNFFGLLKLANTGLFGQHGMVVAIDVDNMMRINTTYGTKVGDDCLRALTGAMRLEIRQLIYQNKAVAFRSGGDEFAMVLPGITQQQAIEASERIKQIFQQTAMRQGLLDTKINLHIAIREYYSPNDSVASFVESVYLALNSFHGVSVPEKLPGWAAKFIDNMAEHICETVYLLQEARQLALTDEISGLPNHRAASIHIDELIEQYEKNNVPFSLLLADGDHLKEYNNISYEHGNDAIRKLGSLLTGAVRYGDQVARWLSGDEFVVLLPGADVKAAYTIAERLRQVVEDGAKEWPFPITISIGVASCPLHGITAGELISYIEAANLEAKRMGKNRVV